MTQCITINLLNLQPKLKSAIKNGAEITLNLSSNLVGSSNDETNFPHKLLLTDTQVSKICKALANGSSANIKFSKTQLSKMIQSGGILGELLVALPYAIFKAVTEQLIKIAPKLTKYATKYIANKG